MVCKALNLGVTDIGENYAQEFLRKRKECAAAGAPGARWHFIGHLQRRKARDVVGQAHLIHSLDSIELANKINEVSREKNIVQECLLEINIGAEDSKSGIAETDLGRFLRQLPPLTHLRVTGLMILPPFRENPEETRPFFKRLKELRDKVNAEAIYSPLTELSMGMSHDFEVAIEEGATLIRVGTALFGERAP